MSPRSPSAGLFTLLRRGAKLCQNIVLNGDTLIGLRQAVQVLSSAHVLVADRTA